ncbi:lipase [Apiospora kogelbergensis]|uniref:Lipase n=1 Tax=Apiospora kogelbergensis TaxID=1337665 RepID=A0AAW0QL68_9PEZI
MGDFYRKVASASRERSVYQDRLPTAAKDTTLPSDPHRPANKMLLLHQVGSVKIGEIVRYTVTYTPSHDRILPSPEVLHLRIRNTSNVALRAAFVHGPYTLNVSAWPSHYDPNTKFENPRRYGVPEFEPMLKAGGTWNIQLLVPDNIRESAGLGPSRQQFGDERIDGDGAEEEKEHSATWVVEVASQVIFSNSAAVGYEVILARDEKSLNLGSATATGNQSQVPQPGRVSDFQQSIGAKDGHHPAQPKGVFSRAVTLKVDDTASLWNTPQLPEWDETHGKSSWPGKGAAVTSVVKPPTNAESASKEPSQKPQEEESKKRKKKVHLVVLTHGLHSNLGADMLYMKESIDSTVRQAKVDGKARRARQKAEREAKRQKSQSEGPECEQEAKEEMKPQKEKEEEEEEFEDEEVVVRGFSGNATRTERGIKFLGKRLARYVLSMTYPDQPFLPSMKSKAGSMVTAMTGDNGSDEHAEPSHKNSTIHQSKHPVPHRAFQISSISFIGHSLGGIVQTYAIAYIQKHSPQFFDLIRPINFITLASPMLGLSNENPRYVKFALDFGLVGKTGQDLGLTWKAPTLLRSGWGAIVNNLGETAHKKIMGEVQPESKPLLRILPTGPAHAALKKFRNRTVYSNVVNDGIVPLRTSCLLFLDWQGLERVEKARREAGLVERVVGFGWAELTGANVTSPRTIPWAPKDEAAPKLPPIDTVSEPQSEIVSPDTEREEYREVPQPPSNAIAEDDRRSFTLTRSMSRDLESYQKQPGVDAQSDGPLSGFLNFFKSSEPPKSPQLPQGQGQGQRSRSPSPPSSKHDKIYKRSQTIKLDDASSKRSSRSQVTTGQELSEESVGGGSSAPPRTSFFEAAGDILNPALPTVEFLIDPSTRPRTIFHDRIYHPSDIPPPPLKKKSTGLGIRRKTPSHSTQSTTAPSLTKNATGDSTGSSVYPSVPHGDTGLSIRDYDNMASTDPERDPDKVVDSSNMAVEEKIARAYHKGMSWRKVLVKLEPDAHNNILVRRMFANANGWPVVKHLVDAHFSDSAAARMDDEDEANNERAKSLHQPPDQEGSEVRPQVPPPPGASSQTKDFRLSQAPLPKTRKESTQPIGEGPIQHSPETLSAEASEAEDAVPDLPSTSDSTPPSRKPSHSVADRPPQLPPLNVHVSPKRHRRASSTGSLTPPRPTYDRSDSVTWSDRDWLDSQDESDGDNDFLAYGHRRSKSQEDGKKGGDKDVVKRTGSPVWNWTEKIVGRGASKRGAAGGGGKSGPNSPAASEPPMSPVEGASTGRLGLLR